MRRSNLQNRGANAALAIAPLSCVLLGGLGLGACVAPNFGSNPPQVNTTTDDVVSTKLQKDVDILFLIDNSPSMSPKQQALAAAIPKFIQAIEKTGANYQVGVATSDVGSWEAKGKPWSVTLGTCNSFEGDDGLLQRVACNTRSGLTQTAVAACQSLCPDPKFVPEGNAGFIRKVNGVTNVPKFMDTMTGADIGL